MIERNTSDGVPQIPQGFMDKMLAAMPRFVTGLVGSFLGIAIAMVIVLKLGGMDVAFSRVINAYAAGFEAQMTRISQTANELDRIAADMQLANDRFTAAYAELSDKSKAMAGDIEGLKARVSVIEGWSCQHEKAVGRAEQFGKTLCK